MRPLLLKDNSSHQTYAVNLSFTPQTDGLLKLTLFSPGFHGHENGVTWAADYPEGSSVYFTADECEDLAEGIFGDAGDTVLNEDVILRLTTLVDGCRVGLGLGVNSSKDNTHSLFTRNGPAGWTWSTGGLKLDDLFKIGVYMMNAAIYLRNLSKPEKGTGSSP